MTTMNGQTSGARRTFGNGARKAPSPRWCWFRAAVLVGLATAGAAFPARAHDYHEGTIGRHGAPFVTCVKTGGGAGRLEVQPNAAPLPGGRLGVRYHVYAWQGGGWVARISTDHYIYDEGVSYSPVVLPVTPGFYTVVAEYWWSDARAWSGQDRIGVTAFTQASDWSRNPVGMSPPAPFASPTCETD